MGKMCLCKSVVYRVTVISLMDANTINILRTKHAYYMYIDICKVDTDTSLQHGNFCSSYNNNL